MHTFKINNQLWLMRFENAIDAETFRQSVQNALDNDMPVSPQAKKIYADLTPEKESSQNGENIEVSANMLGLMEFAKIPQEALENPAIKNSVLAFQRNSIASLDTEIKYLAEKGTPVVNFDDDMFYVEFNNDDAGERRIAVVQAIPQSEKNVLPASPCFAQPPPVTSDVTPEALNSRSRDMPAPPCLAQPPPVGSVVVPEAPNSSSRKNLLEGILDDPQRKLKPPRKVLKPLTEYEKIQRDLQNAMERMRIGRESLISNRESVFSITSNNVDYRDSWR